VTSLNLVDTDPVELTVDAVVIGVHSVEPKADGAPLLLASGAESVTAAFEGRLSETLSLLGATGAPARSPSSPASARSARRSSSRSVSARSRPAPPRPRRAVTGSR